MDGRSCMIDLLSPVRRHTVPLQVAHPRMTMGRRCVMVGGLRTTATHRDQAKPSTNGTRVRKLVHRENALHRVCPLAS